ncbi:hypothetical protein HY410_00030 [Candidatus Gottesmanbacteria bacterium]|nr:hypothetical protein [Candidatus Gottesmanbacteria bacterium]
MKRIVALAIITLTLGVVGVVWNPDSVRNQSSDVLGCTTTCTGPYDCVTVCTTPTPGATATPTPGGGGATATPTPAQAFCSQGCWCQPDNFGGCWCECSTGRDTSQFACEGNPACEWGPTGCYCCATCGSAPGPSPTPGGCVTQEWQWGPWSACFGSPAVKTRQGVCGDWQTVNCTGTIQARAHQVSTTNPTCADISAGNAGVMNGSTFQFTSGSACNYTNPASCPSPGTQVGSNYVAFSNMVGGSYTLVPQAPGGSTLVYAGACWTRVSPASNGTGLSGTLSVPDDGDTLTWDVAFGPAGPWVQTAGGNVLVGANLISRTPFLASPRLFNLVGSGGFPGLVTYGTTYDLDASTTSNGSDLVSSTNWFAQGTISGTNWYEYFRNRFGLANATTNDNALFPDIGALTKPASREKPYYIQGNVATSGNWSVGDGEAIIVVVDGSLTINGSITITGNGFIAFIVKDNISIASTVGVAASSSTSVLDGIYVAGNTFQTGGSTNAGTERLVATGSFIANSFLLQRDLDSVSANETTAAELFIYNPNLFLNLPDSMKEHPVTWQEVAP